MLKPADDYNATVSKRFDINARLAIFRVKPDSQEFSFVAGQYTTLGLNRDAPRAPEAHDEDPPVEGAKDLIKRAYSISSGSITNEYVEFYVAMVSSGELTPRLFALSEGDRLFMGTKAKGLFTLKKVPEEANILMVATGTGLAPYVSMMRSRAWENPGHKIAVLHGASYAWDLGYRNELEELAGRLENFAYVPIVSRPEENAGWTGRAGRLTPWLENPDLEATCGFPLDPETTHVLLCGNPAMIKDAEEILAEKSYIHARGKNAGSLHVEKYW
jgi:ferredoxin/flavodoxin---NADP+ reductase